MAWQTEYFPMGGGEDRITPAISVDPGRLLLSQNYDCDYNGGYRRISGYERFDGRLAPSDATFYGVRVTSPSAPVMSVGQTLTGGASGATLVINSISQLGTSTNYVITALSVSGTFVFNETVTTGTGSATLTLAAQARYAADDTQFYATLAATRAAARAAIQAVPGSGPVRGVVMLADVLYAFRDAPDALSGGMWQATSTGWSQVNLGHYFTFNTATEAPPRTATVSGVSSGATATVVATSLESGDYLTGTGVGRLYAVMESGSFSAGETLQYSIAGNPPVQFAIAGTQVTSALPPGGYYRFSHRNYYATSDGDAVYAVNGVGRAFSWDGTTFAEIVTGNTVDIPLFVAAHRDHLYLGFAGGSLQASSLGNPHDWEAINGAAEFGVGADITGLLPTVEVMLVFTRHTTNILYGNTAADWDLKPFSNDAGAIDKTDQFMGRNFFLGDRGLTAMDAIQAFGNFASASLSTDIDPILRPKHNLVAASVVVRNRNLYRLFFSDGSGITAAFRSNELVGFTQFRLAHTPYVAHNAQTTAGDERVFFGGTDGVVYEMEKGSSFDGEDIEYYIRLHFNHNKSPRQRKRYHVAVFEGQFAGNSSIFFTVDYGYATADVPAAITQTLPVEGGGGFYGSLIWSQFIWSAQAVTEMRARVDGTGNNIGFLIAGKDQSDPHTWHGVIVHYSPRRTSR